MTVFSCIGLYANFFPTDIRSSDAYTEELCSLVNQLPQANKDTLAFLLQHLHKLV